ncbi:MAG TPA: peptide chain release factor N(5)-glutamine methyltransferase [Cytophagales bacterium]|nr:peptide chain release factor N(5)-glutamine methyltransferase [Cytophagales bacterium]
MNPYRLPTSSDLLRKLTEELEVLYGKNEAKSISFLLIENIFGWYKTYVIAGEPLEGFSDAIFEKIASHMARLKNFEPIQYVLNEAHFYGRKYYVDSSVLVPRPETEELVSLIISQHKSKSEIKIIDIGTGSGCIAITLDKEMPPTEVYAMEINKDALNIARKNASLLNSKVMFVQDDIFNFQPSYPMFDVVVSNPPYVTESEKGLMHKNVLDHEPSLALFVPDEDPVRYYQAIVQFCDYYLKEGGKIYFEINERLGNKVMDVLRQRNYKEIYLFKDFNNKNRIVSAVKSN